MIHQHCIHSPRLNVEFGKKSKLKLHLLRLPTAVSSCLRVAEEKLAEMKGKIGQFQQNHCTSSEPREIKSLKPTLAVNTIRSLNFFFPRYDRICLSVVHCLWIEWWHYKIKLFKLL